MQIRRNSWAASVPPWKHALGLILDFALMRRLIAWGNNSAGAIDPDSDAISIAWPVDLTASLGCDEVLWHGWACSILRNTSSGVVIAIGTDSTINDEHRRIEELQFRDGCRRILGVDRPRGYLDIASFARTWDGSRSSKPWIEVGVTQLGMTLGWSENNGLVMFPTLEDLLQDSAGESMRHPLLNPTRRCEILATESRAFVYQQNGLDLLFEAVTNRGGRPCRPTLLLIEGIEGIAIEALRAAVGNRLAMVSTAGQAFVLEKDSQVADPWDCAEDVRLLSLLSDGEIAVGESKIWITGQSKYGELGYRPDNITRAVGEMSTSFLLDDERWPAPKVMAITSSRWSSIMTFEDEAV